MNFALSLAAILLIAGSSIAIAADAPKETRCFELRVYHAAEGKLDALNARFRSHTMKLFEKHGITNIGYWMPLENPDHLLYYMLAYPSREARDTAWNAFMADPDWKAAFAESEKDGKLVTKVDQTFLHATDYSPEVKPGVEKEPRAFELRTYTCTPNNLPNLHARFRDFTMKLFEKHGMTNFGYWVMDELGQKPKDPNKAAPKQAGAEITLIYMLAHKSKAAGEESFKVFRADPDWVAAKAASEKNGPLTEKDGVKSVFMAPTDYSPTK